VGRTPEDSQEGKTTGHAKRQTPITPKRVLTGGHSSSGVEKKREKEKEKKKREKGRGMKKKGRENVTNNSFY